MSKPYRSRGRGHRDRITANHHIKFPEVRVLSDRGEQVGIMSSREAREQAEAAGKDLVLITGQAKPPVVKIIDLAKYKYQQQQKAAASRKKAKQQEIKEVRLTPFMGDHDFETRLRKITKFLEGGDKVRITIQFRGGRQLTKKDFGYELVAKVVAATQDISEVEMEPKMIGRKLIAQLMPTKKKTTETKAESNS